MHGFGGGMGGGGWLIWIILIGVVVWAVITLTNRNRRHSPPGSRSENSALEVLKERYANGEISKEEFEEKKRDLKS